MRGSATMRLVMVVGLLLAAGASLRPAAAQEAARGSIVIHPRLCPLNLPEGASLFDECHDTPGPDDVSFTVDGRRAKAMDRRGNVSFGRVTAGDHLVTLTSDFQPNEFLSMRALCSNINPSTGTTGPNEATVRGGEQASFFVRVGSGSQLVCDVYFIREGGVELGTIVVHPRLCPFDLAADDDLFVACHDEPGPDDVTFAVDEAADEGMDEDGNVSLGPVPAGDHLITLTTDYQPNEFLQLRAYCTNIYLTTGETSGPNEAAIRTTEQASFFVRVGAGAELVCDVYFLRESGR